MRATISSLIARTALVVAVSAATPLALEARIWTSTDGKQLQAEFVKMDASAITLKLNNGQELAIPKDRLVKADHEAAERFAVLGDDTNTIKAARAIDGMLAQTLVKNGVKSFNDPLPDDLFVRRAYLDIAGRIPTREEFLRFAESARDDKRAALIDELLTQPGYASNLFNYFADMYRLHGNADFPNGIRFEPYIQWWKENLQNNTSYDELVRQMITAQGNLGQNPAAGFLLRDAGMEFDAFANFGQVMVGIDISCAQCHDHPFDDWMMDDFYEMAAFFGQTQRTLSYRGGSMMAGASPVRMPNAPENWKDEFENFAKGKGINLMDPQNSRQFRYYVNFLGWNLADVEERVTPVPENVGEIGGKVYDPRVMIGKPAKSGGMSRREALAEWLISDENPRFAPVIANRMWSRAFGRALVEPVNDFPVEWEKMTAHPDVLKFISLQMQRVDYDLREFMRILYNTKAYQTMATAEEPSAAKAYLVTGPVLRRMRAEQAWDSLMVLAHGPEIDAVKGRDGSFVKSLLNLDLNTATHEEVFARYTAFEEARGKAGAAVVTEPGSLDYQMPNVPALYGLELIRASEMQQPGPPASLLDTFGQSDRFVTDEHTYDGSVPQVLSLMNGAITNHLTGSSSKVVEELAELDAPEDKVRGVYQTMLSRFPTEEERSMGVGILDDYGDDGIRDLAWALMNSPEFLFIQ